MLIYKATSNTTGKVYIGQTSQRLIDRINQHKNSSLSQKDNYHFHNAINCYGFNDFIFEVIEDNIKTINDLDEREKYWISYYNSYENGYNSTRGGRGRIKRDDELIIKLFSEGKTVKEICEITGYNRSTIYKSFSINQLTQENNERKKQETSIRCASPVLQYDLNGNFIKKWESASECGRAYGEESLISAVCRQRESYLSAYGFLFKYEKDPRSIDEWVSRLRNKKNSGRPKKSILKKDTTGQIIERYESAAEAARALGLKDKSNICRAARKRGKSCGYYWEYE